MDEIVNENYILLAAVVATTNFGTRYTKAYYVCRCLNGCWGLCGLTKLGFKTKIGNVWY
jgi:hypothetical protein